MSESDRCAKYKAHRGVHEAFEKGDLDALKAAMGNPPDFPNALISFDLAVWDYCLEYAVYWSPLPFIRTLLELGASPNYKDQTGFPSLIAALSTDRADKYDILELLLSFGADTQQRGVNDYTPLHYAVGCHDLKAIELLLSHGADPNADDCTTPLEDAEKIGFTEAVQILRKFAPRSS
ncbi:MAG: ankyrin repeat domain-containing protein [Nitrospiraceae bacterium]